MINVKFYTFSKKENSTARPSGAAAAEFSCLIKSGSGIVNPELEINTNKDVSALNYCYIAAWRRYYFVSEWTWDDGQWICQLKNDVLASWKDEIGASTQYVARSSAASDPYITDTFYPLKTVADIRKDTFSGTALSTNMLGAGEKFLVGIINNDNTNAAGAVTQYVMSVAQLNQMKAALMTDNGWIGNVDPGWTSVQVAQSQVDINPFQYITSCKWYPVDVPHLAGAFNNIRCGWWASSFSAYKYYGYSPTYQYTLTTPRHTYASTRGMYLNNKGFASYILDFAGFHFDLDANMVAQTNSLEVDLTIDFISGVACCQVIGVEEGGNLKYVIAEQFQTIAVSIPLASIAYSNEGLVGAPLVGSHANLADHLGNALSLRLHGSYQGGAGVYNYIGQGERAIAANMGINKITSTFSAGAGGIAGITAHPLPVLTSIFQFQADEDNASAGRPLCKNKKISSIAGFIMCSHVELPIPAMDQEIFEIKSYMEGGFFYE